MEQTNKDKEQDLIASLNQICHKPNNTRISRMSVLLNKNILGALEQDIELKQQVLLTVLQLAQKHRTSQVRSIIEHLLADIGCFEKILDTYGRKAVEELYMCLESSCESAGRHLIKTGDDSDRLYIILSGEVMVLYPRPQKDIDKETQGVDRELIRGLNKHAKIAVVNEETPPLGGVDLKLIENYSNFFNNMGVCLYQIQNVMSKGRSFGQLGILYQQKRMAHIVCMTDCIFASVSAQRYMIIIEKTEQYSKFYSTMFFLEQHFYSSIRKLDIKEAQRFMYMFVTLDKKINSTIVNLKSVVDGAYFVLEGSVVLRREDNTLGERSNQSNFFLQKRKRKLQDYRTLITGDCFGLNECVDNQMSLDNTFFEYEATAASNCKLLFCPADKLLKSMKEDHRLEKQLEEKCKTGFWVQNRNCSYATNITSLLQKQYHKFPMRYYLKQDHSNPSIIRSQSKKRQQPIVFQKYEQQSTLQRSKSKIIVSSPTKCISQTKALRLSLKKRLHVLIKSNIIKSKEMLSRNFQRPSLKIQYVSPMGSTDISEIQL